jgi:two-component system response regulator
MGLLYSRDIHLLLVEDNPGDVWLMREALRLAQFPVQLTVAHDGVEATRFLRHVEKEAKAGPDLVVLDLNLPRRNGREVLADMKRSSYLQSIPVVVLSSSNAEEDRRHALILKASDFVTKPSSLPAYVELVRGMEPLWAASAELRKTA